MLPWRQRDVLPGAVLIGGAGNDELHPDGRDCRENLNAKRRLADYTRCVNYSLGGEGNDRIWHATAQPNGSPAAPASTAI